MNYLEAVVTAMRTLTLDALGVEGYYRIWSGSTDLSIGTFTICPNKQEVVIQHVGLPNTIVVSYADAPRSANWLLQYTTADYQLLAESIMISFREYLHGQFDLMESLKVRLQIKRTVNKLMESIVKQQVVVIVDGGNQPDWVSYKKPSKKVHHVVVPVINATHQLLTGLLTYDKTKPIVIHAKEMARLPTKLPFIVDLIVQLSEDKQNYIPIRRQHTAPKSIPVSEFEDFLTQYAKTALQNQE